MLATEMWQCLKCIHSDMLMLCLVSRWWYVINDFTKIRLALCIINYCSVTNWNSIYSGWNNAVILKDQFSLILLYSTCGFLFSFLWPYNAYMSGVAFISFSCHYNCFYVIILPEHYIFFSLKQLLYMSAWQPSSDSKEIRWNIL